MCDIPVFSSYANTSHSLSLVILKSFLLVSPWNSPRQLAITKGFAEANSVFIVIILSKILLRWLFLSKIYIQFTIFNICFSTKLSFTNKRYHLHVLEKCLCIPQEVRSIIYFRQFIHPLSVCSCGYGTRFAFMLYIIIQVKFYDVTFLNNLFCYILLPFAHLSVPKKNKTCDSKQKLFRPRKLFLAEKLRKFLILRYDLITALSRNPHIKSTLAYFLMLD